MKQGLEHHPSTHFIYNNKQFTSTTSQCYTTLPYFTRCLAPVFCTHSHWHTVTQHMCQCTYSKLQISLPYESFYDYPYIISMWCMLLIKTPHFKSLQKWRIVTILYFH